MTPSPNETAAQIEQIRALASPLRTEADLDPIIGAIGDARFAALGEASHGNHEFYQWRAQLSRRLIEERGFTWIGVEADWPDCWRVNWWVRGEEHQELDSRGILAGFERWPTWMWANAEMAEFLTWLRTWNLTLSPDRRVGFYGLDVYSLWDSLRVVISWLATNTPEAIPAAMTAWQCFVPYNEDPHRYAWSTRLVPESCEFDVLALLVAVHDRTRGLALGGDVFNAVQNAEVAAGAERYYRAMLRGDRQSWNLRDQHMMDTIDRVNEFSGPTSKALIWAHNTHIGDARATDMAHNGLHNLGQLLRVWHSTEGVALVGFAAHRGSVLAAPEWGESELVLALPAAAPDSHEDLLHRALTRDSVLVFGAPGSSPRRTGSWASGWRGHRAVGVVWHPQREMGNYVPTVIGERYDALVWVEDVTALHPLHHEAPPSAREFETEPSGF